MQNMTQKHSVECDKMYYAKLITASSLDAFKVEIYSRKTGSKVKSFYSLSLADVKDFLEKYIPPVHGTTKSSIIARYTQ